MLIHRPTALHLIRPYYAIWHLIHTFHKVKKKKKKLAKHLQNLSIQTKEHISWFISDAWLLLWQSAEEQFVAETSPRSNIYIMLEKINNCILTMIQDI